MNPGLHLVISTGPGRHPPAPHPPSRLAVFEKLDLAEALLGLLNRLIWASEVLSLAGNYFTSRLHFLDHHQDGWPGHSFRLDGASWTNNTIAIS